MKFDELVKIVETLRSPDGCPWDREQTRESLKQYLVEEFYEVVDALEEGDHEGMKEEFGDLLFQIVLQSQLSKEEGLYDIYDVIDGIGRKMVQRHPHVFGDRTIETSAGVEEWWEEHKKKEGKGYDSAIGGVPRTLPALLRARKIQQKATKVGFDWEKIDDVFEKLKEETEELRQAVDSKKKDEIESEIGDILFVMVRIANAVNVNPEDALRRTIRKFTKRFHYMEEKASVQNRELSDMTLDEMEPLWNEAKKKNG